MQYLGGKKRLAPKLAAIMSEHRKPDQRFVDVFCGGLSLTVKMGGPRLANDGCVPLMNLYRAWQRGWRPSGSPTTEKEYAELKARQDPDDPMTAFAGFGLSFGGKWFGGFARKSDTKDYFHGSATRELTRKLALCDGVKFTSKDFGDVEVKAGDIVYADPPYIGTTGYGFFSSFPYDRFLSVVRTWTDIGATVFVSEYTGSSDWDLVWEAAVHGGQLAKRPEKLFMVRKQQTRPTHPRKPAAAARGGAGAEAPGRPPVALSVAGACLPVVRRPRVLLLGPGDPGFKRD